MVMAQDCVLNNRIIVPLPAAVKPKAVVVGEVLLQEGFDTWLISVEDLDLYSLVRELFGARAVIGLGGISAAIQLEKALSRKPDFIQTNVMTAQLHEAVQRLAGDVGGAEEQLCDSLSGVEIWWGAMTPTEIQGAVDLGAHAICLVGVNPGDSIYGETLAELFPDLPLLVVGSYEPYQAGFWFDVPQRFVCPGRAFSANIETLSIEELRKRCSDYRF